MDCPTCGKHLRTEQGVRQHHAKVHDHPLPNRTCKDCETDFYDPKSRRVYCDDCDTGSGEKNGNYRNAKETTTCEQCGTTFDYYPSNKNGTYCSDCVADADGLLPENPSTQGERVECACPACGRINSVVPSRSENSRGVFCSPSCSGRWRSRNVVGPEHHQWKGGSISYGQGWWRIRRKALRRDQYRCQQCGRTERQLGQKPDVHHVEPVRDLERREDAHRLENVVSLCRSCHRRVEEGLSSLEQ